MMKFALPAVVVAGLFAATGAFAQDSAYGPAPKAAVSSSAAPAATPVSAPSGAPAAAKKFTSASSLVDIMNNPAAKAAMAKTLPDLIPILEMFLDQIPAEATLDTLPDLSMGMVTADQVKLIDADLRKI